MNWCAPNGGLQPILSLWKIPSGQVVGSGERRLLWIRGGIDRTPHVANGFGEEKVEPIQGKG